MAERESEQQEKEKRRLQKAAKSENQAAKGDLVGVRQERRQAFVVSGFEITGTPDRTDFRIQARDTGGHVNAEELKVCIITHVEEFDKLEAEWNAIAERSGADVFQTWHWNRIWWKYFGKDDSLHLITMYQGNRLVGIIPFFRDRVKVAGVEIYRCFRLLGSNVNQPKGDVMLGLISYTDYLGFIIEPGYGQAVCRRLAIYLHENQKLYDEVVLESIPEQNKIWRYFMLELKQQQLSITHSECAPSLVIHLNRTWGEYLGSLNTNRRYKARRHIKMATDKKKKVFNVVDVESEEDAMFYFDRMVEMHQKRWNRLGALGTFYEKRNHAFHKEIARSFWKLGWIQMKLTLPVTAEDTCVAIDLNYKYNQRIYCVHRAVDDESPWYKMGPGNVMLNMILKEATESEVECYDFLRGDEGYKVSLADETRVNRTLVVGNKFMFSKLKASGIPQLCYRLRQQQRQLELLRMMIADKTLSSAVREFAALQSERATVRLRARFG